MKIGDMPPPLPVSNPRIRDCQALIDFFSTSDKMHCATPDDGFTHKHGLITVDHLSSEKLREK